MRLLEQYICMQKKKKKTEIRIKQYSGLHVISQNLLINLHGVWT